jgi:methylthioribose-1-phosphate isomerase
LILHNVQANEKGALTLEEPTLINPRIAALKPLSLTSQASSAPPKTLYNRSRKRNIAEIADNKDKTINSSNKKVDLRVAITSLSKEIARNRHVKETYESNQEKAIKLLKKEYKARLEIGAFLKAISLFKDKENAVTFLTLDDAEYRDLWLEIETNLHLK